jgi:hypothetical protein
MGVLENREIFLGLEYSMHMGMDMYTHARPKRAPMALTSEAWHSQKDKVKVDAHITECWSAPHTNTEPLKTAGRFVGKGNFRKSS